MIATIVRCTPQPKGYAATPPTPAELQALASKVDQDLWAIWNYLAGLICQQPTGIFMGCWQPGQRTVLPASSSLTRSVLAQSALVQVT